MTMHFSFYFLYLSYLFLISSREWMPSVAPMHSTAQDAAAQANFAHASSSQPSERAHKKPDTKVSPAPVVSTHRSAGTAGIDKIPFSFPTL